MAKKAVRGVVELTVDVFDLYLDKFRIFINGKLVAENQANFSWILPGRCHKD